ncbi:DUF2946 domain-containing protein [Lautropia mirabilis]
MLAKLTSKNQLTLPKALVAQMDAAEYFEVSVDTQSPIDHTLLHDGGHCPYCRLQQEVPAMPHVPQPLVLATITSVRQALQLAPTPPPVAPTWPPQLSRAPPQLS